MEKILINIDSRFRNLDKFPDPGNFVYNLKEPLKNITSLRLASIELPTTFYTFLSRYNNIDFTIIDSNGYDHTIIIEEGNYTSTAMMTYIQGILTQINLGFGTTFTISWDSINYKVTITNDTPFTLLFGNDKDHMSLGFRLGYRGSDTDYLLDNQGPYYDVTTNTFRYGWTGDTFLDITKDEYLFLRINDYGVIYNDIREKSILAKIILYDQQFVIDNGANFMTKSYQFKQPVNLSKFDIELVNSLGETVDMNLINFSLTLELEQIYDGNTYNNHNFVPYKKN